MTQTNKFLKKLAQTGFSLSFKLVVQFELVTASFNDKEKLFSASYSQFQQPGKNVELITASFNDKENPVWASYSQSQQPGRTGFR